MDLNQELQAAADQLDRARRKFARGENGLRLLSQSREAFINSLRNTGLTYADAKIKFDNCLDEQEAELLQLHEQMLYAERMHQYALHRIALQHPRPSQTRPNPRWPVERPAAAPARRQSGLEGADEDRGIDPRIVQADVPVQVRPVARPVAPTLPTTRRAAPRPHLHVDRRHVAEHADHALAVVQEHGLAVEEIIPTSVTTPAAGALIGVPAGTAKSSPECGLRSSPLKMRRRPKGSTGGRPAPDGPG